MDAGEIQIRVMGECVLDSSAFLSRWRLSKRGGLGGWRPVLAPRGGSLDSGISPPDRPGLNIPVQTRPGGSIPAAFSWRNASTSALRITRQPPGPPLFLHCAGCFKKTKVETVHGLTLA
nr:hypothetical protein [uncultured Erwinia sp.]